jgi:hypothetical protein
MFSAGGIKDCDHLFFLCGLGKRIWKEIMGLCFVESILHNWAEILICGKKNLLEESLQVEFRGSRAQHLEIKE